MLLCVDYNEVRSIVYKNCLDRSKRDCYLDQVLKINPGGSMCYRYLIEINIGKEPPEVIEQIKNDLDKLCSRDEGGKSVVNSSLLSELGELVIDSDELDILIKDNKVIHANRFTLPRYPNYTEGVSKSLLRIKTALEDIGYSEGDVKRMVTVWEEDYEYANLCRVDIVFRSRELAEKFLESAKGLGFIANRVDNTFLDTVQGYFIINK